MYCYICYLLIRYCYSEHQDKLSDFEKKLAEERLKRLEERRRQRREDRRRKWIQDKEEEEQRLKDEELKRREFGLLHCCKCIMINLDYVMSNCECKFCVRSSAK